MITASNDEKRSDNFWRVFDGETQVFAFNAPASWANDDVLTNWRQVRDEANDILSPETQIASLWRDLRVERDRRLAACDWTQLPDSAADKLAWAAYRRALRDLPGKTADPSNPVWPEEP